VNTDEHWKKIGKQSHSGICIPLSSLHTKTSCGIGEFSDLIPLIDWCASLHLDVIQLLPLFDTGDDASPYDPISSCALDPVYLKLANLPAGPTLSGFAPLTALERVNRSAVKTQKLAWLNNYFQAHFEPNDPGYQNFLNEQTWILPYARFKVRKEGFSTDFHCYLQYLCHQELRQVHEYASSKTVFLKGDIPYLLNANSVDVLEAPHLFNRNLQAGAPPDYYNPNGQNWGCPLFNWDAMQNDHFRWWKRRMKAIFPYYDIYRIDHVVGLFRIWGIKQGKLPTEGSFVPSDPSLWPAHGLALLEMMISSSPLLPMAEDLGTIPPEVRVCLKQLGICGTKVIRWERNWNGDKSFTPFNQYEQVSLTTCSTMDSDTLNGWWEKTPDEATTFAKFMHWNYEPRLSFEQHKTILQRSYHTPSLFHINLLQDILALFPELVWGGPDGERINIPGTLLPTNWTYRFKPSVEEIASHAGLTSALREILQSDG
jgi:4-alpha-glucanotransferase